MSSQDISFRIGNKRIKGVILEENLNYMVISVSGTQIIINDAMTTPDRNTNYSYRKRQKVDEIEKVPKLYIYNTNLTSIEATILEKCCKKECLNNIKPDDLLHARIKYFAKTQKERKLWLREYVNIFGEYFFCGRKICSSSFRKIYAISNDLHHSVISTSEISSNEIERTQISKKEVLYSWMEKFKFDVCDALPDTGKFVVPFIFNWKDVHESYCQQIKESSFDIQPLVYQSSISLIKINFPEIKLYKYTKLTKCDICVELKIKRIQHSNSTETIQKQLHDHLTFIRKERLIYMQRSFSNSNINYLSIIIDGMTSLLLPHRFPNPKSMASINPIKISPLGLISHSEHRKLLYLYPDIFPKGSNLIITILWGYILSYYEIHNYLPKILYFQADNAAKESKNQYLLSFLALIVKMGYFDEIYFNMYQLVILTWTWIKFLVIFQKNIKNLIVRLCLI